MRCEARNVASALLLFAPSAPVACLLPSRPRRPFPANFLRRMTSIAPLNAVPSPSGGASPQWDGVTSEYERRVEPFTLKFGEDMLRDMLGSTAAGTGKGEGGNDPRTHKILDLGCGTGGLSLLAASLPGCLVTAVDVSPSMADRTRLRSSALGLAVDCAVSDGQSLPPGWSGSFDCALANFSFIFFPEPTGGVREVLLDLVYDWIHRVLGNDGSLPYVGYDVSLKGKVSSDDVC